MKSHAPHGVALRTSAILVTIAVAGQASANQFVWQRAADWVPGNAQGGTANNPGPGAGGATIWQYEYTQGGRLGSSTPWYAQPTSTMTWDPSWYDTGWGVWSKGDNVNPPVLAGRLVHNTHISVNQDIPLVRWNSPFGPINDLAISGSLLVNWNGMNGVGQPVDVDVVVAKQNSLKTSTTLLFSTTVSKPNPFASVGDSISIPVNLSNISMGPGESIVITHRGRNGLTSGGWVNLFDNVTFTSVPTPGTLGLLGLAGIAAVRRRRN
jgi:MYXO-CTERM domain-containing protein